MTLAMLKIDCSKITMTDMKGQAIDWEKHSTTDPWRALKAEYKSSSVIKNHPIEETQRNFTKEDSEIINKHRKRYLISFIMRKL